ncbi:MULTISPECIES: RcnB family protein [unclassified Sinorhizobium]|uniref:RcnB family protein n=1 Tax=unclassified Sinorhizobium TaxID=2613772 RepID=UPI0024C241F0|nr:MULTISPECIES: RcnB family protein [unclassified Sinorhizobium]MDK1373185.1 RcnB family protein [Sinorhizobium sp. 6-70]MDK1483101.1 RcnB family protein [Sinorhizobium sp. 6-117]
MKRLIIALVASSFLASPMAFAQPSRSFEVAQVHDRYRSKSVDRHVYKHVDKTVEKRVIIKKHRWARGHRLSPAERRHMAYVRDYRRYKLRTPPRGQQWVRVDNDFLLISLATGVIVGLAAAH